MHVTFRLVFVGLLLITPGLHAEGSRSHPPLRVAPPPANRPLGDGPTHFVDAAKGHDTAAGTKEAPWQTIGHALKQLQPGDTLVLRGGVYYENVSIALQGRQDAKITLRSHPGEQAILDGSLRELAESPADAWAPLPGSNPLEFRSKRRFPNLRDVCGSFGDSMIGLQTYYHAIDLRATGELVDWQDWNAQASTDIQPLYCGPGLWYDHVTGHIHARLAHTHLPVPVPNYNGPTDPRQVPLLIAPFRSTPLRLDGARHIRLQDLVIRGAGYAALEIDQAANIELDNLTIWCGAYGLRVAGTQGMRMVNCGVYGNVAPWTFRGDGSKRDYPGRPHRNISRLNTHALLEIDSGRESSVYATPQNDDWEIAHCEFTDAHDGVYLGSINVKFHHNRIDNLQDDGIYLSPMYMKHRLDDRDPQIHVYQNIFSRLLTALAYGGTEAQTRDTVWVYRNLFDLRGNVQTGRPSTRQAAAGFSSGKLMGDHGSPPWSAMNIYHNTCVMAEQAREPDMAAFAISRANNPRRVFNNIFLHFGKLPALRAPETPVNLAADGNLFWSPAADEKLATGFFAKYVSSSQFTHSQQFYPAGSMSHSFVVDPKFARATGEADAAHDYRLQSGSPAIDSGVAIPADWPDPLRTFEAGQPDLGAIPIGAAVGQAGRLAAPGK